MRQLDRFIAVMLERGASAIAVTPNAPVRIESGGRLDPLTRQPVTAEQIDAILKGGIPDHAVRAYEAGEGVTFGYESPGGAVQVTLDRGADGASLTIRPQSRGEGSGNGAPAAAGEVAASPPAGPAADTTSAGSGRGRAGGSQKVDALLRRLVASGGSDLHLRVGQPPIIRRDGGLSREEAAPLSGSDIQGLLDSIMSDRDREIFTRDWDADFAHEIPGLARFRVNAAMDRNGPMIVFRTIPSDIPTCADVGVPPAVQDLCLLTKGLVVVTGPTGSGKSTTLAAMVDKMNREREDHILTIEDPIEFVHQSQRCLVTHRQVGEHTKSFKSGLRAALREDPDIILIGELRDLETVAIAIETAETGHLVFGTLHTTTAASTVERIVDQFPGDRQAQIRVMLSESLRGVVAQTLLKKKGGGRVAAREILLATPAVSNLIREGKTFQIPSIMQTSRGKGMCTLNDSLMELVDQGLVEPKEAYMKSVEKTAFLTSLKSKGVDTSFVGAG